ncbi:hypothetical protein L7F22_022326 [Adiantum nelumboides]|nr:hypothetical protein [Adiantum nelumboides]
MEVRHKVPRPGHCRFRIGKHGWKAGTHGDGHRPAVGEDGHKALTFEADIEEAAGHNAGHFAHHGDLVLDAGLEGQEVVPIDNDGVSCEAEEKDALALIGKEELRGGAGLAAGGTDKGGTFVSEGLLHGVAEAVLQYAFALEFEVACVGDHDAHLHIDHGHGRAQVHAQESVVDDFKGVTAAHHAGRSHGVLLGEFL